VEEGPMTKKQNIHVGCINFAPPRCQVAAQQAANSCFLLVDVLSMS
jgi:hypothetical protein